MASNVIDLDDMNIYSMLLNGLNLKTTLGATVNHTSRTQRDKCSRYHNNSNMTILRH